MCVAGTSVQDLKQEGMGHRYLRLERPDLVVYHPAAPRVKVLEDCLLDRATMKPCGAGKVVPVCHRVVSGDCSAKDEVCPLQV
jgi:hypothetical protein